jgi:hypothetical protein
MLVMYNDIYTLTDNHNRNVFTVILAYFHLAQNDWRHFIPKDLSFSQELATELVGQKSVQLITQEFEWYIRLGWYVEFDFTINDRRIGYKLSKVRSVAEMKTRPVSCLELRFTA